jgi:hypothetical protein
MQPGTSAAQRPGAGGRGIREWLPIVLIGALIVGGLAMIASGLLGGDDQPAPAPAPEAQQTTPAPETQEPAPAEPAQPAQPAEPAQQAPLRRRSFAGGLFSIGTPAGWKSGGGPAEGFSFEAPGSTAAVTVFFEQGARPAGQLAELARDFLAQRHAGAQIGAPKPTRLADTRALRVTATYGGGTETAVALSSGGFAYLVLERVDASAPPGVAAEADAVLASFKPR